MDGLRETINNPNVKPEIRLAALQQFVSRQNVFPASCGENNNHIHTVYSFSPYTPSMAALRAKEAGLEVAGSVDHDSISAAAEMKAACTLLKMGCVTGFEVRVDFRHTAFAHKKINNPDSAGLAYMTVQGVPSSAVETVKQFLIPIQKARAERTAKMVDNLNRFLAERRRKTGNIHVEGLSFEDDVLPLSMAAQGGGLTERHMLYALAKKLTAGYGRGAVLIDAIKTIFAVSIPQKTEQQLLDTTNSHYLYDMLGLFKSAFLPEIFIQPDTNECPKAETVTEFAQAIGAIPAYAYLGDVGESPTGDKKAEQFEDCFLDALVPQLKKMGYLAITYMPPRNTLEQLRRLQALCKKYEFMEISGVDINSSRQQFNCPEIRADEFAHLIDATWALVAHEKTTAFNTNCGLFAPQNPRYGMPLADKVSWYARIGKNLEPVGTLTVPAAIKKILEQEACQPDKILNIVNSGRHFKQEKS